VLLPLKATQYGNSPPGTRNEALWLAAERGDLESLQVLAVQPFIDPPDDFRRRALARAAAAGKTDAVELLIRRGASIDVSDLRGITPLMLAARAGSLGSVTALLEARANPNAADQDGNTVLMHAARGGQITVQARVS